MLRMSHNDIAQTLLTLIASGEGIPISIKVAPADDVLALRDRIAELEREVKSLSEQLEAREFQYRQELMISGRLVDLLRENQVKIPRWVFDTR